MQAHHGFRTSQHRRSPRSFGGPLTLSPFIAGLAKAALVGGLMAGAAGGIYFVASTHDDNTDRQQAAAETPIVGETVVEGPGAPTLDQVNAKRELNGLPTFAPGEVDLSKPNIFPEVEIPTETPRPSPTPWVPSCGPRGGGDGAESLVERYGDLRTDCGLYLATEWVITLNGAPGEHGVIGVLSCASDDQDCLDGLPPASETKWEIYPLPFEGSARILAFQPPETLLVNGGACFNIRTRTYDLNPNCGELPTSTVPR